MGRVDKPYTAYKCRAFLTDKRPIKEICGEKNPIIENLGGLDQLLGNVVDVIGPYLDIPDNSPQLFSLPLRRKPPVIFRILLL